VQSLPGPRLIAIGQPHQRLVQRKRVLRIQPAAMPVPPAFRRAFQDPLVEASPLLGDGEIDLDEARDDHRRLLVQVDRAADRHGPLAAHADRQSGHAVVDVDVDLFRHDVDVDQAGRVAGGGSGGRGVRRRRKRSDELVFLAMNVEPLRDSSNVRSRRRTAGRVVPPVSYLRCPAVCKAHHPVNKHFRLLGGGYNYDSTSIRLQLDGC